MTDATPQNNTTPPPGTVNKMIHQAKNQLEHMIDSNPQIMLLVDAHHHIVRANKAVLTLLGCSGFDGILGRSFPEVFPCKDPSFFDGCTDTQGGYNTCETEVDLPGRPNRILQFTIVGSGKGTELFALIVKDITEESESARETERQHKKEAVRSLMGALMHSINQPLTVIMMRVQLMLIALKNSNVDTMEFSRSLQDIMRLTMQIADTLRQAEEPADFVTEPYLQGIDILDIEKSSNKQELDTYSTMLLDAFLLALDAHSPGSTMHAKRTGEFAARLAKEMEFDDKMCEITRRCGYFHDLGKIGIPDDILQKPGALDETEMETMKRHSEIGYDLLRSFPFLENEAEAAYAHHERFDGKGYPQHLEGIDIPLYARITSVADAFDALRFHRTYNPPVSLKDTIEQIVKGSGTQFDPEVVQAFLACNAELDRLFANNNTDAA